MEAHLLKKTKYLAGQVDFASQQHAFPHTTSGSDFWPENKHWF
jgi:hypothetical protein